MISVFHSLYTLSLLILIVVGTVAVVADWQISKLFWNLHLCQKI